MQRGTNGGNGNHFELTDSEKNSINNLEEMPEFQPNCAEGCLKPFLLTLRASFVSGNNYERLVNTCEKLRKVYECMDRLKKCQQNYLFRIFMDGFKYMCVEHPAAFRDLMECIDLHTQVATKDCEQKCKAHNLIAGWFIHSAVHSNKLLHAGTNGAPPRVNIGFLRKITSEACSILQCYFLCLKTKYNARCHGIGGNLLVEAMVRPIYRMHNSMLLSPFWNIMRLMMPSQCNFMMTDEGISWQRINPKLDKDLKEFYKNRTESLIKFRPPAENFTTLEKSVLRQRTKRINKEIDIETFITVKRKNETKNIKRDNIEDYLEDCRAEYRKDCDDNE
ncbi:Chondroitin proteoglycan 4 family protein [Acanthocheilonema viteae]